MFVLGSHCALALCCICTAFVLGSRCSRALSGAFVLRSCFVHSVSMLCPFCVRFVLCPFCVRVRVRVRAVFVLCLCCVCAVSVLCPCFASCCVHVLFVLYVRAVFASVRELFCNHMSRNSNLVSSPSLTEAILIYLLTCSVGAKPELEIHSLQKFAVSDTQLHAPIMSVSFLYYFPPNGPTRANTKTAQQTLV